MNRDRYDLVLTTASEQAAAHYRDGVDCMLSAWHGAEAAFDRAIDADPGFALAHMARARLHQLNMEGKEARAMATRARELAAGATPREIGHIDIMAAVIEGKPKVAVSAAEAHLEHYPRDAQPCGPRRRVRCPHTRHDLDRQSREPHQRDGHLQAPGRTVCASALREFDVPLRYRAIRQRARFFR